VTAVANDNNDKKADDSDTKCIMITSHSA
jgi:hypothetical protein